MTRFGNTIALISTASLALLASAPLMLVLEKRWDSEPLTYVVVGLLIAIVVPVIAGLACRSLVSSRQPLSAWLAAGVSVLGLGVLAMLGV